MTWGGEATFEVSSSDPPAAPDYVDLTDYVRPQSQMIELNIGRQTQLTEVQPSQLTLQLSNADERFTFGNPSSPYAAWWEPGRLCRLRESVGGQETILFTGYLETPTETVMSDAVNHRWVSISAMDRLARLERTPAFLTTLAEYIRYNGGSSLVAYWPLADPIGSTVAAEASGGSPLARSPLGFTHFGTLDTSVPMFRPGEEIGPAGDDASYLVLTPHVDEVQAGTVARMRSGHTLSVPATGLVAMSVWVLHESLPTPGNSLVAGLTDATSTNVLGLYYSTSGGWDSLAVNASGSDSNTPTFAAKTSGWQLATVWIDGASGDCGIWIDDETPVTGNVGGAGSGTFTLAHVSGYYTPVSVGHLQVYAGTTLSFTYTMHVAQYLAGFTGLERQSTGTRVRTILDYAGIPASEIGQIDDGVTVMSIAQLAEKNPLTALREAERTEQGLLYVDGSGLINFADRRRLYNI